MIHIDIFIAIFHYYDKNSIRYIITEKQFKHYINIKNKFSDKANFTFTIVGSEKEDSKQLSLKYFNVNEYFEFDQNDPKYNGEFWSMFNDKVKYGMKLSSSKGADICLWAGSNDVIHFDFFEQIIDYYNPNKPQIYGIDNYYNGNNLVCVYIYKKEKNVEITNDNDPEVFWWDGISNYCSRNRFHYAGGIIGINKNCYTNSDIINRWHYDEGLVEEICLKIPEIDKFQSNNIFYFNVKVGKEQELNRFWHIKTLMKNNLIKFNSINNITVEKIKEFYMYLNDL